MIFQGNFFYNYLLNSDKKKISQIKDSEIQNAYQHKLIKKGKRCRDIYCMDKNHIIYRLQRRFLEKYLNRLPISQYAYGFVKGKSYFDFLAVHTSKNFENKHFLKIDILDFFGSIEKEQILNVFKEYVKTDSVSENEKILEDILKLVTVNGVLPQGAITSPAISNLVFRRADIRIARYCEKFKIKYSRYADDMIFSSDNNIVFKQFFFKTIRKILWENNFEINHSKTIEAKGNLNCKGFIIKDIITISRNRAAQLNQILYICEKEKRKNIFNRINTELDKPFRNIEDIINYLNGYRSFLIMVLRSNNNGSQDKLILQIKRLEMCVNKIS